MPMDSNTDVNLHPGATSGPARAVDRRVFLRAGLVGFSSLTLRELYGLRAATAQASLSGTELPTAVILIWLRGGASHLETFDPKPDASSEFRGPYAAINTNVPGIQICELLPRLAKIADRYAILRSMAHTGGGHPAGSLQVLAGDSDRQDKIKPVRPDWMSIANYLRHDPDRKIPNYVAINPVDRYDNFTIAGPTYLGPTYEPFKVIGDPSRPTFDVSNIGLAHDQRHRLVERLRLKETLDQLRRDIDQSGMLDAADQFEAQAINMLTSSHAREAFELS